MNKRFKIFSRKLRKVYRLRKQNKKVVLKNAVLPLVRTALNFNFSENPKVSIIIPFFNEENYTWNCLRYLSENLSEKYPYEIILINDNSTENVDFSLIKGVRIIENTENLGFLKNINKGISAAKGEYVYLLNNDTEVAKSFLDELFFVFENFTNVGAVGSKLINKNKTLQEAGAVFLNNFKIHQIVTKKKPYFPEVNYITKVDYCSGCSLLFKKNKEDGALNLLDEQFIPAYFEETDLCFDLRHNQHKDIYYTPFSEVTHFNGVSYNKEVNPDKLKNKALLFEKNKKLFYNKWKTQINQVKAATIQDRIIELKNNKRIVFFSTHIPCFDQDSGANRFKEIVTLFLGLGYHVSLVVENVYFTNSYINYYQRLGVEVFYEHDFFKGYTDYLNKLYNKIDVVWFYGPDSYNLYFKSVKKLYPNAKYVYDMIDIHHLRFERSLALDKNNKSLVKLATKYKAIEIAAAKNTDHTVVISDLEGSYMKSYCPIEKLITVSNIHYTKIAKELVLDFKERQDLLFIGSTHHPNVDAMNWLYQEIMPKIWDKLPEVKVHVVGKVDGYLKNIKDKRIIFHGYVPQIEPYFLTSKLMVAPLRIGAGVKGKIGQAFEYYLPVVTTLIGSEGMFLKHNEGALIADEPEEFANEVLRLYTDEILWAKLSQKSEENLTPFSKENLKDILQKINI